LRRGVTSHLFVAVVKRRTLKDYASQIQTQTAQSAGSPTGSAEALARPIPSPPTETPRPTIEKKIMKIQINTDNHLIGREALAQQAEARVRAALGPPGGTNYPRRSPPQRRERPENRGAMTNAA
jgi:hypothetical protein